MTDHGKDRLRAVPGPGRRLSVVVPAGVGAEDRALPERPDGTNAARRRLHPGTAPRERERGARTAQVSGGGRPHVHRDGGQGRAGLRLRAGARRRGRRDLATLLAGLPHGRAHRQGAPAPLGRHRRHRVGPRRPGGRHGGRPHRGRGHLLEQHQRLRTRRHDDPLPRPQLPPLARLGRPGRLEHRRLRRALVRSGGNGRRLRGGRPDRLGRPAPSAALRRGAPLHRPSPPQPRRRAGARS